MKALVTGGAGFIGSNLVQLLLHEGWQVVILDNLSTGYRENIPSGNSDVQFIEADVRDAKAVEKTSEGCNAIFHLAASVGNLRSIKDPVADSDINVLGTLCVLEAARKHQIAKVVFSSSAGIFGEVKETPQNEEHPTDPDSPYGVGKLAAEKHCLCYNKLYGMKTVALRYFNVYGPNQRYDAYGNVISIFATRLRERKPITIYGDGEQTRDFVNVQDVACANYLAAIHQEIGGSFNVGSGTNVTINRLAEVMQEAFGIKTAINYQPPRKGEVLDSLADITKARQLLNYQPKKTLPQGLMEYYQWLIKQ